MRQVKKIRSIHVDIYIRRVVGSKNFPISETVYDLARFLQNLSRLPKKAMRNVKISRAQPPSTCPSNGFARIKALHTVAGVLDEPLQSANPSQWSSCKGPPVYICVHPM
jgi:hypothetical protein